MEVVEQNKCCGCRACVQICPVKAITVTYDTYEFEKICIDENKCLNCGKCKSVCPILNIKKNNGRLFCGIAYSKNNEIRKNGSSGGIFGSLARYYLKNNGIVYGAAFKEDLSLQTMRVVDEKNLSFLYKSKYILCNTNDSFSSIKKDLSEERSVLYCSTPCQIAALKGYLGKEYDNLVCVDILCHGVGSQKHFNKSIEYIETKKKCKIIRFSFREKFKGAASRYYYSYIYKRNNKTKYFRDIYMTFPYFYAYENRLTCRDSCYNCPYMSEDRIGDITIGDFHGIEKYEKNINRFDGVSMIVCNNQKGFGLLKQIKNDLFLKEYSWDIIKENGRFKKDEFKPRNRLNYIQTLTQSGSIAAYNKFLNYKKDWHYYYYHLPKWIRDLGIKLLRGKNE